MTERPESERVSVLSAGQTFRCDRVFGVVDDYDVGETADNCMDRFYIDSVQIFLATETPTTAPMGGTNDDGTAQDVCLPGIKCPATERLKVIQFTIGHNDFCQDFSAADCSKIVKCELVDGQCTARCATDPTHPTCMAMLGSSLTDYSDATAPILYQSDRLIVKAKKDGLVTSIDRFVYYRVKFATPSIIDDEDETDVSAAQAQNGRSKGPAERRDVGDTIELQTDVTVSGYAEHGVLWFSVRIRADGRHTKSPHKSPRTHTTRQDNPSRQLVKTTRTLKQRNNSTRSGDDF